MVQDTIGSAILIIAVVIATVVVLDAVYPAMFNAAGQVKTTTGDADSLSKTSVTIVSCSFAPDYGRLDVWLKNSGKEDIASPADIMVYYGNETGGLTSYAVTASELLTADPQDATWDPGETYQVSIGNGAAGALPHDPGVHRVKVVVLPGGVTSETTINV